MACTLVSRVHWPEAPKWEVHIGARWHYEPTGILGNGGQATGCTPTPDGGEGEPRGLLGR